MTTRLDHPENIFGGDAMPMKRAFLEKIPFSSRFTVSDLVDVGIKELPSMAMSRVYDLYAIVYGNRIDRMTIEESLSEPAVCGEESFSTPATWWDHLKQTLQLKYPKVFRKLRVGLTEKTVAITMVQNHTITNSTKISVSCPHAFSPISDHYQRLEMAMMWSDRVRGSATLERLPAGYEHVVLEMLYVLVGLEQDLYKRQRNGLVGIHPTLDYIHREKVRCYEWIRQFAPHLSDAASRPMRESVDRESHEFGRI
jgi:hypothetical protein